MSETNGLPRGWVTATLNEVVFPSGTVNPCNESNGVIQYVDIEALDNTHQRIVAPKTIQNREAPSRARMRIRSGDVLFSLVRPYLKNIAVVPADLDNQVASTAYCVLRPACGIDSAFLFFQIVQESFIHSIPTYGNSPPAARDDEFLATAVRVAPTREQRRIVQNLEELFSKLDAGVAALERVRVALKRYRSAVLKAAVEGKLTAQWRTHHPAKETGAQLLRRILDERRRKWEQEQRAKYAKSGKQPPKDWQAKYKEPTGPDTSGLPTLPEGWCWVAMGQVARFQNGHAFPSKEYSPEGIELLRPGNLFADGTVRWTAKNTRFMPTHWADKHPSYLIGGGELVMNLTAQSLADEFLGRTCLTDADERCLLNQRLARITPFEGVNKHFLLYLLKSSVFRMFVNRLNRGSLIEHMFTSQLEGFCLPMPPTEEQTEIVQEIERRLSVVDELEAQVEASLKRAPRLRQSILRRAFEGRLVPQDPRDEPAELLLQKIRQAREGENGRAASRRKPKASARLRKKGTTGLVRGM